MRGLAVSAGLLALMAGCSAQATEQCRFRVSASRSGDLWIVSGAADTCEVRRVVTPSYECRISFDTDHGMDWFQCGEVFAGRWGSRGADDPDPAISDAEYRKIGLPSHSERRVSWLAPIDTEGLNRRYPISEKEYLDYYPRRFTQIGAKMALENPEFLTRAQTLHYVTMKGEKRAAISGEAALDCLRLHFYTWTESAKAEATERDMSSLLRDLRLKAVNETSPRRDRACRPRN